jgi:hypothetical protein
VETSTRAPLVHGVLFSPDLLFVLLGYHQEIRSCSVVHSQVVWIENLAEVPLPPKDI